MFDKYGEIKVIKFCETQNFDCWRIWVEFATHEVALSAFNGSSLNGMECKLLNRYPSKLDADSIYPERANNDEEEKIIEKSPLPA